ncbi:MAG TPA: histidine kinase [Egicoccus sp.]|nr:histidine kinase [Egicoccus sp.]HSK24570.1 histidine kinase [Egicoccus sp.]
MLPPGQPAPRPPLRPRAEALLLVSLAGLGALSAVLAASGGSLALPLALAWGPLLVLWWRHELPLAVFALLEVAAVPSRALYGANGPAELLLLVAMYTLASRRPPRWAVAAVVVDTTVLAVVLASTQSSTAVLLEAGGQALAGIVAVLLGLYVQSRRAAEASLEDRADRLQREGEEQARAAVEDERRRIARELHDVVAHHVSVMTLQAGALEKHLDLAGAADELTETAVLIRRTGQEAMTELRRLLGVLHRVEDPTGRSPQPDLAALDALAARMRDTGMPVDLHVVGPVEDVTAGMALAVHRIVQEALTNTLRHAGPVPTEVRVSIGDAAVEAVVRDPGPTGGSAPHYPDDAPPGAGRGLVGMRERAALFGGTVTAGPHPDGGFEVRAVLPRDPRTR